MNGAKKKQYPMAKRFTSTKVWDEDWFLEMPNEYKLFWYYMLSACDHAGLFKVNLRSFCGLNEVKISADKALSYFNVGKQRIRKVSNSIWYIEDFFVFQYGSTFNVNNPLHRGIKTLYDKIDLKLTSIRGLKVVYDTLKEKEIDKVIEDIEIKEGGVGETIKNKKDFPLAEDFNGLPEMRVGQAIEYLKHTKQVEVTSEGINAVWQLFKSKHLTGKKYYNGEDGVYSHFLQSLKYEKFDNHGTHKSTPSDNSGKLGTSEARVKGLENW